jgi:hypothetical protein
MFVPSPVAIVHLLFQPCFFVQCSRMLPSLTHTYPHVSQRHPSASVNPSIGGDSGSGTPTSSIGTSCNVLAYSTKSFRVARLIVLLCVVSMCHWIPSGLIACLHRQQMSTLCSGTYSKYCCRCDCGSVFDMSVRSPVSVECAHTKMSLGK